MLGMPFVVHGRVDVGVGRSELSARSYNFYLAKTLKKSGNGMLFNYYYYSFVMISEASETTRNISPLENRKDHSVWL